MLKRLNIKSFQSTCSKRIIARRYGSFIKKTERRATTEFSDCGELFF
jgi:hypothetical protein